MITVLYEEIFDFLAANVALVLTVDSAEGCIGLKRLAAAKRLILLFEASDKFCHRRVIDGKLE